MPTSAWALGDGSDDDSAEWRDEYSVPVDSHQVEDDATRLGLFAFGCAMSAGSLVGWRLLNKRYGSELVAVDEVEYCRDVPTGDHPAVLADLCHRDKRAPIKDMGVAFSLTASLMRLNLAGAVDVSETQTTYVNGFNEERTHDDYLVELNRAKANAVTDPIDRATLDFLFGFVAMRYAQLERSKSFDASEGIIRLTYLRFVAAWDDVGYLKNLDEWHKVVRQQTEQAGYGTNLMKKYVLYLRLIAGADFVFAIPLFASTVSTQTGSFTASAASLLALLAGVAMVVVGVVVLPKVSARDGLTTEGKRLREQMLALRRWLLEFSRLDEAVPSDVALWRRLLTTSVALEASDEVVAQLDEVAPQVMAHDDLADVARWCKGEGGQSRVAGAAALIKAAFVKALKPDRTV